MAKHIIVIGGGMTGTSAAHRLNQLGYTVTIIEKNDRLGGRVHSHHVGGTSVEMGAGFLTARYTNLMKFLTESGLSARLRRQHSPSGILRHGQVTMVSIRVLLGNRALSWGAKLQAIPLLVKALLAWGALDTHAFWKAQQYDTKSVTEMVSGKGGKEFLEYVLQPILNGYFYWTPEHTSQAMMLILVREALSHGTYRLGGGLQQIPEALAKGSTVLIGHEVQSVTHTKYSYSVVASSGGKVKTLQADGIVCATTASVVPHIFPKLRKAQEQFFAAVEYSSTALTTQTYDARQAQSDRSIAFPRKEGTELSTVTLSCEMGDNGTEFATNKTYASGTSANKLNALSDEQLIDSLAKQMEPAKPSVLHDAARPIAAFVQRWPEALPFFDVGHFTRLQQFENGEIEDRSQPLVFAGDYIGGPFMEGAFTSGLQAAERLHCHFKI